MAVIASKHWNGDTVPPIVIDGRPDFGNHMFGVTHAKKFPPYVFSINQNSGLVHRVRHVTLHWYRVSDCGSRLVQLRKPVAIAQTFCSMSWRLEGRESRTCQVPNPDAILCGRCQGTVPSFSKKHNGPFKDLPRPVAHVRLGCVVAGY